MTKLEKIKTVINGYEGFAILDNFRIDYTDALPANAGLFPAGLVELERDTDILGNTEVQNQLNFALYVVLNKAAGDDELAEINADWLIDFAEYIQDINIKHQHPAFGDYPESEVIIASDGHLYDSTDEGLGLYVIEISVRYTKKISKN